MKMKPGELRLYAVTDRAWAHTMEVLEGQIAAAIKGGATFVQLREKDMQPREFLTRPTGWYACATAWVCAA